MAFCHSNVIREVRAFFTESRERLPKISSAIISVIRGQKIQHPFSLLDGRSSCRGCAASAADIVASLGGILLGRG